MIIRLITSFFYTLSTSIAMLTLKVLREAKPCGNVFLIFTLDARDISGSRNELVWPQAPAEDKSKPLYGSFRTVMARSG